MVKQEPHYGCGSHKAVLWYSPSSGPTYFPVGFSFVRLLCGTVLPLGPPTFHVGFSFVGLLCGTVPPLGPPTFHVGFCFVRSRVTYLMCNQEYSVSSSTWAVAPPFSSSALRSSCAKHGPAFPKTPHPSSHNSNISPPSSCELRTALGSHAKSRA